MSTHTSSGGLSAIFSTLKHAAKQTGLVRATHALARMNNAQGFDCPGCAWPEPEHRARFEFCENGAKVLMSATTTKIIDETFWQQNTIAELNNLTEYQLEHAGRLVTPVMRQPGKNNFTKISYEQAIKIIAGTLKNLDDPNQAVFYTSGRASNEAAFLFQLLARQLGTNNLCDCSNLCHESSGIALKNTLGTGKGTVQLSDFLAAQVIFLIGHNPSTNHPRMLSTLKEARRKGAHIVVVNPIVEPGLLRFRHPQSIGDMLGSAKEIANYYFQVKIGGDRDLFYLLLYKLAFDTSYKNYINTNFIQTHTSNFDKFIQELKLLDTSKLLDSCGLTREEVTQLSDLIAHHDRVIYAWGMGITQTTYGVATIEAIANLAMMRGHLGKPGAGVCPVRGHSNVQGNRTVGITHAPAADFINKLKARFALKMPQGPGLDVVDSIAAMRAKKIKFFMALGGNFLSASPDTPVVKRALENCDLKVYLSTKLNKTHLVDSGTSIILPCLTRVEKDIQNNLEQILSVENSMSIVHASRGNFTPLRPDIWSEPKIIAQLAHECFNSNKILNWLELSTNYNLIRDHIAFCIEDLADYNNKLKSPLGFMIENPVRKHLWKTASKKAQFSCVTGHERTAHTYDYDLLLTTIRSHDQFNTAIFGLNDRYRGITNQRDVIFMNKLDIKRLNLENNMRVDISSRFNNIERSVKNFQIKVFNIKEGCAAAYFPEANNLIALESVALHSNTPTSKYIAVFIKASS
jgi:molybdopterin-dependent oxidoreductase alpha subunit